MAGCYEHGNKSLCALKCGVFIDWLMICSCMKDCYMQLVTCTMQSEWKSVSSCMLTELFNQLLA